MVRHPGKTAAQRRVLDEIGCGNASPIMRDDTKYTMLKRGLIEKCGEKLFGSPPLSVRIDEYQMPIPVHIQWCEYQAQNESEAA